jgi:hypothetical protein
MDILQYQGNLQCESILLESLSRLTNHRNQDPGTSIYFSHYLHMNCRLSQLLKETQLWTNVYFSYGVKSHSPSRQDWKLLHRNIIQNCL